MESRPAITWLAAPAPSSSSPPTQSICQRRYCRRATAAAREEREARGRHYAEADIAAPHPGDTPIKATGRHAAAEVRRTLSGRPSRTYLIVALLTGALGLMASVWPRMVRGWGEK